MAELSSPLNLAEKRLLVRAPAAAVAAVLEAFLPTPLGEPTTINPRMQRVQRWATAGESLSGLLLAQGALTGDTTKALIGLAGYSISRAASRLATIVGRKRPNG